MNRLALSATALAFLFLPTPGWSHSALERSDPQSGAVLQVAPNELRIWFSEPIKVGLSTIEVRDESGRQVDEKNPRADEKEKALVRLALRPNLAPGSYKVSWTAVAQDMHASKGAFEFKVAPR